MEKDIRRTILWVLVYLVPAFQAMLPVDDPDLWWHLRTAQWMIEHGQVPIVDSFSAYGFGKPWVAYSWLFELLVYNLYSAFGLMGIVALTLVLSLLIAVVLHALIRPAKLPFILEVVIMAVALGSLKPLITPRSWLFSILFFAIELWVLFHVRRTGKLAYLWVLPPLFALWANIHIQFVYGLAAIACFWLDTVVAHCQKSQPSYSTALSLPLARVSIIVVLCGSAVFLTPYHYHMIPLFIELATQTRAFNNILEFHPMFFRSPGDWLVLALTLAGAYLLGWERKQNLFSLLLVLVGVFVGFRARRDVWVVVVSVLAITSEIHGLPVAGDFSRFTTKKTFAIIGGVALGILLIGYDRQITNLHMQGIIEKKYPVKAVQFVTEKGFAGPLFNNFDWGGYLIWSLPQMPVSIDNRMNVHGDPRIERSLATWAGKDGWSEDPDLMNARLIIAEVWRPLVSLLREDSRFKLVYEDATAAVFIREDAQS